MKEEGERGRWGGTVGGGREREVGHEMGAREEQGEDVCAEGLGGGHTGDREKRVFRRG